VTGASRRWPSRSTVEYVLGGGDAHRARHRRGRRRPRSDHQGGGAGAVRSIVVIPGFFNLTRIYNTGAAFGLLNDFDFPFKSVVLSIVAAIALGGLAVYGAALPADQRLSRLGLAFIVGGAAGNLIDRVWLGFVVDFFDFYWGGWHFWAFNVADAAITVGVALMVLDLLGLGRDRVSRAV
jgi:signal peptidase II